MRRNLLINLGLLLAVLVFSTSLVVWYLNSMRTNQEMVSFFHVHISNFAELFYLSTIIQQQQIEIRSGISEDINPLVDNILEIDHILRKASDDMDRPQIVVHCRQCHQQSGNQRWRSLEPQIHKLRDTLASYKLLISEIVTNADSDPGNYLETRALRTSRQLVTLSGQVKNAFDKMELHLVMKNRSWVAQTQSLMIGTFLIAFLAFFLAGYRLVYQIVKPVLQLEQATKVIAEGSFPEKLIILSADELGSLGEAFNHMVDVLKRMTAEKENLLEEARNFNQVLEQRIAETRAELKAAEEHLVRSETLSAMGTLAAGVSHEISNPIHVIMGICSLSVKDLDPSSQVAADLKLIEAEAARCQKIVNGLLDFARYQGFEKSLSSMNRLIEESLELIKHQKWSRKIEIVRELAPDLPQIMIDPNRIKQVIVNLLINAGQAMPEGGRLTVRTSLKWIKARNAIVINVEDTGIGIPMEIQKKIFDPFFTTKKGKEGTGLGLAISHRIIEEHGGSISVQSEPGRGAAFTILIPLSGGALAADGLKRSIND